MKFLVDAQLPPSLAERLRAIGSEAVHVEDAGLRNAADNAIREYVVDQRAERFQRLVLPVCRPPDARLRPKGPVGGNRPAGPVQFWQRLNAFNAIDAKNCRSAAPEAPAKNRRTSF